MTGTCDNCGQSWPERAMNPAKDLDQRLEPGGLVPLGECPNCGALCYPDTGPFAAAPELLEAAQMFDHPGVYGLIGNRWGNDRMQQMMNALRAAIAKATK